MNRFKITLGRENDFENIWKERDTHLESVPGFKKFNLIKGKKQDTNHLPLCTNGQCGPCKGMHALAP